MPCNTLKLEPWNPFDTSDRTCFPPLHEALLPGSAVQDDSSIVVDIDILARHFAADIDELHPHDLGFLPLELTQVLEQKCQSWFDEQQRIKAVRGDSPTPSCNFKLPGIPFSDTQATCCPKVEAQHVQPMASAVHRPDAVMQQYGCTAERGLKVTHAAGQSPRNSFSFSQVEQEAVASSPPQLTASEALQHIHSQQQHALITNQAPRRNHKSQQNTQQQSMKTSRPDVQQAASASPISPQKDAIGSNGSAGLEPGDSRNLDMAADGIAAGATSPVESQLNCLMQQNLTQVQQLMELHPAPLQQQHDAQDHEALQQRLSLLLQRNQAQLQQLIQGHQLQEQQLHGVQQQQQQQSSPMQDPQVQPDVVHIPQHHNNMLLTFTQQQQQQDAGSPLQLPTMLRRMQQQLAQLQLLTQPQQQQQQLNSAVKQELQQRQLAEPGRFAATQAATQKAMGLTPGRVRKRVTERPSAQLAQESQKPQALGQTNINQAPAPVTRHARSCMSGASAAAAAASGSIHLAGSMSCGRGSPVSGSAYQPYAVFNAQTSSRISPQNLEAGAATEQPSTAAWRGLQAMQHQRWQQRLQALLSSSAATDYKPSATPTKDQAVQTNPAQDSAVQTDMPYADDHFGLRSAITTKAATAAVTAAASLCINASPAASPAVVSGSLGMPLQTATVAIFAPVAAAALAAAVAVATATAQDQSATGSSPLPDTTTSMSNEAVAAAAAAAAAAVVGIADLAVTGPRTQPLQHQHQDSKLPAAGLYDARGSALAAPDRAASPALPSAHVVRSLFAHLASSPVAVASPGAKPYQGRSRVGVNLCTSMSGQYTIKRAAESHTQQEQMQAGPAPWAQQQQQTWHQHEPQRPLPWPQLPNLDSKPHLSPMKAYVGEKCTPSKAAYSTPVRGTRKPLGETTNSPGGAWATTKSPIAPTVLAQTRGTKSTAGRVQCYRSANVEEAAKSADEQGGSLQPDTPANLGAGAAHPTPSAAMDSAPDSEAPPPAVTETGSGDTAYRTPIKQLLDQAAELLHPGSTPCTGALTTAAAAAAPCSKVVMGAAGPSVVSGAVSLGSPALQRLWSGYKSSWVPGQHSPAQPAKVYTTHPAVERRTNVSAAEHAVRTIEPVTGLTIHPATGPMPTTSSGEQPSLPPCVVASAALAAAGPAMIDARFYPPGARKLLGHMPARRQHTAAVSQGATPICQLGACGLQQQHTGIANNEQAGELGQLQQLLEQQLLEMDLIGKDATEAAAAMCDSRATGPAVVAAKGSLHGYAGSCRHQTALNSFIASGMAAGQQGDDADVETGSPSDSGRTCTDQRGSSEHRLYKAVEHQDAGWMAGRPTSANRIERLVAMYRQQRAQQMKQESSNASSAQASSVLATEQMEAAKDYEHRLQADIQQFAGGVSEMLRRFLQE